MKAKEFWTVTKDAASKWNAYDAPRLGAALAYYALLSLAPLAVLVVFICGLVFGAKSAEARIVHEASQIVGYSGAQTLKTVIDNAHKQSTGILASSLAILLLLFGASSLFVELHDSLNTIWDAPPPKSSSAIKGIIWQRLTSFFTVLAVGILLLASLVVSTGLAIIEKFFGGIVPISPGLLELLNVGVTSTMVALLFALIFKFVPDVRIDWQDVGIGAIVTAVLFLIGKTLLALYLEKVGVGSTYGAAGSLVALVVWIYYSAQIFLFGAIFTQVYASAFGSRRRRGRPRQKERALDA